jgi:hypothetical protein
MRNEMDKIVDPVEEVEADNSWDTIRKQKTNNELHSNALHYNMNYEHLY